jgi:hypothetical protein
MASVGRSNSQTYGFVYVRIFDIKERTDEQKEKAVMCFLSAIEKCRLMDQEHKIRFYRKTEMILSRVCGDYYKTGIGLTTGFIGSHTVTHNYSVYTL